MRFRAMEGTNDLVQRQEHGDQKVGDFVTWDDAWATVFQVGNEMFEVDRVLDAVHPRGSFRLWLR